MKIGVVTSGATGVDYHRLLRPFALMQDRFDVVQCQGVSSEMFDYGLDVVVFSRYLPIKEQKKFIQELKANGVYVICDVDDYWVLPSNHIALKANKWVRPYMIEAMMYSDEVWTTHELLGNLIDDLNENWYVIPNALDPNEPQWQPKQSYGTRIGWAGGVTHFHDLMLTKDAWSDVVPVICGFRDEPEWRRLSDRFKADYIESMDVENYGYLYDQFDIAIAPLEDNLFTNCKSNLKIIEAGMKGLPIFVQNIHPYTDDSKGIFKVDSWNAAIRTAEGLGASAIRELGSELREYVLGRYNLHEVNNIRVERLTL